MMIDRSICG
uniref:Uncharacterized protein n=1 Tax=Arundo donax TaxID=35708 RepID=A0A0A9FW21_ARUDO